MPERLSGWWLAESRRPALIGSRCGVDPTPLGIGKSRPVSIAEKELTPASQESIQLEGTRLLCL